ncbi:4Fe-4S ferredoxin [Synergistales bacterium]|nr:4Fe-4S ferredoxin [Synergistales bacterium]
MMRDRAAEMLRSGSVSKVLGWEKGEFAYDETPAIFTSADELCSDNELGGLVYDGFSSAMLSKYLINATKKDKEGKAPKALVFLKPCDSYSFAHLLKERKVERENVYAVGVECRGMLDIEKIRLKGAKSIKSVEESGDSVNVSSFAKDYTFPRGEVLLEKCVTCKGLDFKYCDEVIGGGNEINWNRLDRFAGVEMIEEMTPEERFNFWRGELSRCIRCNACRNACPVCSCNKCVFDNTDSGVQSKANADSFEENMFHIIRAFHVAGRCTDCGECSRVCPRNIPLQLLNRKFIKDIDALYGEYQAGEDIEQKSPLTDYQFGDAEPSVVYKRGGGV